MQKEERSMVSFVASQVVMLDNVEEPLKKQRTKHERRHAHVASWRPAAQEEVKRTGSDISRTPASSTSLDDHDGGSMLEKIFNLTERTRTIESYVYEVFVAKRDSTEATSMVSRTRQCLQLCKESAAFSSRTYMAEWSNLECVSSKVSLFFHCLVRYPTKPCVLGFS